MQASRPALWQRILIPLLLVGVAVQGQPPEKPALSIVQRPGIIEARRGGELFTCLYFGRHWDKPFLYPLRTASGVEISRRWPVVDSEERYKDHSWHRGLWWGHGDINGVDFWRELGEGKTGKLVPVLAPEASATGERAVIRLSLALQSPAGQRLGTVRQHYALWQQDPYRFIDVELIVEADAGVPLRFGDTEDGGFAFRLTDQFRQDQGARLMNSEGLEGTEQIWGRPARWVDYSAVLEGRRCGIAVFDHPANLRHPTRWHARGYGLCAANPFALRSFTRNPEADGSYTLPSGQSLRLRYRVVLHEGEAERRELESLYQAYVAQ